MTRLGRLFFGRLQTERNSLGQIFLSRNVRGFEAMLEHLKSDGMFVPQDPDVAKLMQIELLHFGFIEDLPLAPKKQEECARNLMETDTTDGSTATTTSSANYRPMRVKRQRRDQSPAPVKRKIFEVKKIQNNMTRDDDGSLFRLNSEPLKHQKLPLLKHGGNLFQELRELLSTEPTIDVPSEILNIWRKLGPIRLEDIIANARTPISFDERVYECSEELSDQDNYFGQYNQNTVNFEGIVRFINDDGEIWEGQMIKGKFNGFGREIYRGGYYIGQYKDQMKEGFGVKYDVNGNKVAFGEWYQDELKFQ